MKSFNINSCVMFKPTEYGKQHYRSKRAEKQDRLYANRGTFKFSTNLHLNEEGWCKMQMHTFMEYFGDAMYLGGTPVIELCELMFYNKDLTDVDERGGF